LRASGWLVVFVFAYQAPPPNIALSSHSSQYSIIGLRCLPKHFAGVLYSFVKVRSSRKHRHTHRDRPHETTVKTKQQTTQYVCYSNLAQ